MGLIQIYSYFQNNVFKIGLGIVYTIYMHHTTTEVFVQLKIYVVVLVFYYHTIFANARYTSCGAAGITGCTPLIT